MSLDATNSSAAPKLAYSSLPAGSRIVAEPTERGITIRIPPASIVYVILACGFAGLMLAPMSLAVFFALGDPHRLDPHDLPAMILIAVVVLTFWPAVIIVIWKAFKRRRVPTVLTVSDATLIFITPDLPTLRREFPIDANLRIEAIPRGIGVTLRTMGLLRITSNNTTLDMLNGRDYREIRWIAHTLNEAIQR